MMINYASSNEAWSGFEQFIKNTITKFSCKSILEIGGGANPLLPLEYINQCGLQYTVLDISEAELAKAPDNYLKIQADITNPNLNLNIQYDLVFSKMLAEHVKDAKVFHQNIYQLLTKQGVAVHFFPTLYAFPYLLNKLLPDRLSETLLRFIQKGREQHGKHAKFPAYYNWCYGPIKKQITEFENLGYSLEEYIGFFGHEDYYKKLPPILKVHKKICGWLIKYPIPWLTSFAYILLQKK